MNEQGPASTVRPSDDGLTPPKQQRSIGELVASIRDEIVGVINTQVEIAKKEITAFGTKVGIIAACAAVVVFLLLTAWVMFLFFAASGLHALGLPWWASFLIITVVFVIIAAIAGLVAFSTVKKLQKQGNPVPVTVDTAQNAVSAVKGRRHASSATYDDAFEDLYGKQVSARTE